LTPPPLLGTAMLAVAAFVATDTDDIFILVGLFSDRRLRPREIVLGQYLGIGVLTLVAIMASLVSLVIPARYVGLLGLVPIALGLKQLVDPGRRQDQDDVNDIHPSALSGLARVLSVALLTIANGGDNIAVYTPLFATQTAMGLLVMTSVFALMTAAWCTLAYGLVSHPTLGGPIRRYGHRILPFVLIAIGMVIIVRARS
jgi:cadmium resistance protein CadD (predicted permease)